MRKVEGSVSKDPANLRIREIDNGYLLYSEDPIEPLRRSVFHPTVEKLLDAIELMLVPPECSCVGTGSQLPRRHNQDCPFWKANLAEEIPVGRPST